ncbi:MAG: endonuclease/exonuclease/phosphatase family protein [Pseudomonadota bacterium]
MSLKVLSWNIEHFDGRGGRATRTADREEIIAARLDRRERVVALLRQEDPDIFGLSEVEGKDVHEKLTSDMPGYVFNITEGTQSQEILIGVRHGLTAFFTQRNEFKRSNPYLRPGALLTVTVRPNVHVPILFAHLKSAPSPEGFGLRDAMFDKVFELRKALNKSAQVLGQEAAHFFVLGDMNTMGMDYEGSDHDLAGPIEIQTVKKRLGRRGMFALSKSHPHTFSNGSDSEIPDSDLDHVFAANHLEDHFEPNPDGTLVDVGGWAKEDVGEKRDAWIRDFSDHAPLTLTLNI